MKKLKVQNNIKAAIALIVLFVFSSCAPRYATPPLDPGLNASTLPAPAQVEAENSRFKKWKPKSERQTAQSESVVPATADPATQVAEAEKTAEEEFYSPSAEEMEKEVDVASIPKEIEEAITPTIEKESTGLSRRIDELEKKTSRLESNQSSLKKTVDYHGKQLSKLQRLIAEAEEKDGFINYAGAYLWLSSFDSGKFELTEDQKVEITAVVEDIKNMQAGQFRLEKEVEAFTDPTGKEEDNIVLSEKRAQSIINYAVELLGADNDVPWQVGTKWKDYFVPKAGGETNKYGDNKYNRRARFTKINN